MGWRNGREQLERGQLAATIQLADPDDGDFERGCEVRHFVFTSHQRVRNFGEGLVSMLHRECHEVVLNGKSSSWCLVV